VEAYINDRCGEAGRAADAGAGADAGDGAFNAASEERGDILRAAATGELVAGLSAAAAAAAMLRAMVRANAAAERGAGARPGARRGAGARPGAGADRASADVDAAAGHAGLPPVVLALVRAGRAARPPRTASELHAVPLPPELRAAVDDCALSALAAHVGRGDDELHALLEPPPAGRTEALLRRATAAAEAARAAPHPDPCCLCGAQPLFMELPCYPVVRVPVGDFCARVRGWPRGGALLLSDADARVYDDTSYTVQSPNSLERQRYQPPKRRGLYRNPLGEGAPRRSRGAATSQGPFSRSEIYLFIRFV